ncbi:hypothetical protein J6590_010580 [Homalodisca vitripennis]|nr:hypothetical protein J6590_010580 [Homalodisca vitripennis]
MSLQHLSFKSKLNGTEAKLWRAKFLVIQNFTMVERKRLEQVVEAVLDLRSPHGVRPAEVDGYLRYCHNVNGCKGALKAAIAEGLLVIKKNRIFPTASAEIIELRRRKRRGGSRRRHRSRSRSRRRRRHGRRHDDDDDFDDIIVARHRRRRSRSSRRRRRRGRRHDIDVEDDIVDARRRRSRRSRSSRRRRRHGRRHDTDNLTMARRRRRSSRRRRRSRRGRRHETEPNTQVETNTAAPPENATGQNEPPQ